MTPARAGVRWLAAVAAFTALAALVAVAWWTTRGAPPRGDVAAGTPPRAAAGFAASGACRECHAAQFAAWTGSQHARAMQHATEQTVLGDFGDVRYTVDGVTTRFFRRDGRYVVQTDGPDGRIADFEVKYTFGVEPLQQYLVELPGGRLQALAVTWDSRPKAQGGQRWFRQYPNEKLDHRDELHWTKRSQNWNFMCADCHSTDIVKGYDDATDAFDTRWKELSVGCEACHGPGSAHVAWARNKGNDADKGLTVRLDERRGVTWAIDAATGNAVRSQPRTIEREISVCAQCHARRAQIAEGWRAGAAFMDHYLPALLTPGLYHADGQQRDEVFIWGSWLQSRMHAKGVTCSDCHDPHTQKLRAEGNAVCAQCHAPGKYDAVTHHRHAPGSAGAQCAACHMPQATYMVVDARRDHSLRVPRPDQTVALGVPNACNQCHSQKDAPWAAAAVRGWLGRDARGFQTFAPTFHAAESGRAGASASLQAIAGDLAQPAIVRASALERAARAGTVDPATVQRAARDSQPLMRLASVRAAETLPPSQQPAVLAPLLGDALRAVRIEAARALAGQQVELAAPQQAAWQAAADEYVATLRYAADRPDARTALGSFYARIGRADDAQAAFRQALALDAAHVPAYLNAADALREQGREDEAMAMLKSGLAHAPANAALHHALGLSLVRQRRTHDALAALQTAVRNAPDDARFTYVYAVALNSAGRSADAQKLLAQAVTRWPADRNLLFALATMQRDAGNTDAARATVRRLVAAYPDDREAAALAQQLR